MEPSWHGFWAGTGPTPARNRAKHCQSLAYESALRFSVQITCPFPEYDSEVDLNFFFHQVPPLHAALWQSRSEPVKGVR